MEIPKQKIFLIDGSGAFVSTLMLGLVLVRYQEFIGMPEIVLYVLAGIAFLFMIYSFSCYFLLRKGQGFFLKVIAGMNFLYCILTGMLVVFFIGSMTILGILYFVGEIAIVLYLVRFEWKMSMSVTGRGKTEFIELK